MGTKTTKQAKASKLIRTAIHEGVPKKQAIAKGLRQAGISKPKNHKVNRHQKR